MTLRNCIPVLLCSTVVGSCTARGPRAPVETPPLPPPVDSPVGRSTYVLRLTPGTYRYSLSQSADIRPQSISDTARQTVTTTAVVSIAVTTTAESTYTLAVTIDSMQLATQGSPVVRPPAHPTALGQIAKATLSNTGNVVEQQLPDSLCAYGHLLAPIYDVLLPDLSINASLAAGANHRDSVATLTCRGGARVRALTIRELSESKDHPSALVLVARTELTGAGRLSRDSIEISGTIATRGIISFVDTLRLPQSVETSSDGLVTVRLGDSTAVFRQTSSQILRRQ